jgi:uncharacterized protein YqjF (DUF2071 family)
VEAAAQGREKGEAIDAMPRFLTARWRSLLMLNYVIDPAVLAPLVPRGTVLDPWQDRHYVSVVGFLFLHTRVLGIPIPCHRNFEEVNLRFYVRRQTPDGVRRGVCFVKEVVPRWAIATIARRAYNENYVACRMSSTERLPQVGADEHGLVEYRWTAHGLTHALSAHIRGEPARFLPGSEEEYITEHYWGYVRQRDGSTVEYRVAHPPWRVWQAQAPKLECAVGVFYGTPFVAALSQPPTSAFVAEGSPIEVFRGVRLD